MNKQAWMDCALEKGMQGFEIYQATESEKSLTWYDHTLDTFTTSRVIGTSLHGLFQNNMATLSLEEVDDAQMESVIDSLIEQAKTVTTKEEDALRAPEETTEVSSNQVWETIEVPRVKFMLQTLEQKILNYDERVVQVSDLQWQETNSAREITNTLGLHVQDEQKVQYVVAGVVVKENDVVKNDYKIEVVHKLEDFDMDAFTKDLVDNALFKLNATSMPTKSYPVILERHAMTSLFSAFTGLFNGQLIYKGISPIKDQLNEKIFSEKIQVIDNPRHQDALSLANYDDEGCPTKEKVLVKDGVFTQMLHDTKSAICMNSTSTGNGFKSGYASSVGVQPMNCYIEKGEKSLEQMCQEMGDGLVITDLIGLHAGIDFVTTNFSLQCAGYAVKNGKKDHAISLITVAGNYLDLMKQVVDVGSDLEWEYHSIVAPSIRFDAMAISGE